MKKKRVLHPSKLCSTKVLHEIKLRSGFLSVMSTVVETSFRHHEEALANVAISLFCKAKLLRCLHCATLRST